MAPPTPGQIHAAIHADSPGIAELAVLLSPEAAPLVEEMARKAQILARRHFGRTTMLYVPLYLSNYCTGGCAYCGFASDRDLPRQRLELDQVEKELSALRRMGFAEVLLLTGERHPEADLDYVLECVRLAAARFPNVTVEMFPLPTEEYERLCAAGCTGVTIYQETYDPAVYECMHRWGPKSDYLQRLEAPERVLAAGMRTCGIGALLGLASPLEDALSLYLHARRLQQTHWRAGVSVSFPRIRPQEGGFQPPFPVDEAFLAQLIFAFRIVLPRTHLVLSTREGVRFRDGMAGLGVTKMSAASLTTVGGYSESESESSGQFDVSDHRSVEEICTMLRGKGLEPVFKNWDSVYR
ncbi:MAG: 2-iminoacetate synthase ThiH [Lentisphaeria bacterium]|nr:2-iminoacetate synthase ThiH [Lentisphaeria bacterium]